MPAGCRRKVEIELVVHDAASSVQVHDLFQELAGAGFPGLAEYLFGAALLDHLAIRAEHHSGGDVTGEMHVVVTMIIAIFCSASCSITFCTSMTISGSSAEVTSSNNISRGSSISARAIATRCFWPPESWLG